MTATRVILRRAALGAVLPEALLVVWHLASRNSVVVPSILAVVDVLIHPLRPPPTLDSTSLADGACVSVLRVALGFGLACLSGIPVGVLVGRSRTAREMLSSTIAAAMVISPVAWIPIAILVFGLASPATLLAGDEAWQYGLLDQLRWAIMAVIWIGAFFPIVLNTAGGVLGTRESHVEAARVLGASRRQVLWSVVLPSAAPSIMIGLRMGGGIAWRAIIAAEIFPGTRGGLGCKHPQAYFELAADNF